MADATLSTEIDKFLTGTSLDSGEQTTLQTSLGTNTGGVVEVYAFFYDWALGMVPSLNGVSQSQKGNVHTNTLRALFGHFGSFIAENDYYWAHAGTITDGAATTWGLSSGGADSDISYVYVMPISPISATLSGPASSFPYVGDLTITPANGFESGNLLIGIYSENVS